MIFHSFIHSFIHSSYFYSASSSPMLLRVAPDTARILYRSFTRKRHRQLRVKDFPKVPTWRLERDSNPRPSGRQVSTTNASYMPHNAFSLSLNRLGILKIGHSLLSTASCYPITKHLKCYWGYNYNQSQSTHNSTCAYNIETNM